MKIAKKAVCKKINALRARRDHLHSEYMDEKFREKHSKRFKVPKTAPFMAQDSLSMISNDQKAVVNTCISVILVPLRLMRHLS